MNEEEVKKALIKYFKREKANWTIGKNTKPNSETGWDLIVKRKNSILFIEAKGIKGAFDPAFIASCGAVLFRRSKEVRSNKNSPHWCADYCIAFNTTRNWEYDLVRALLYKLSQPNCIKNWNLLSKAKGKYLFLVRDSDKKVIKLNWTGKNSVEALYKKFKQNIENSNVELKNTSTIEEREIITKIMNKQNWK